MPGSDSSDRKARMTVAVGFYQEKPFGENKRDVAIPLPITKK
jgi:hypothetical protein